MLLAALGYARERRCRRELPAFGATAKEDLEPLVSRDDLPVEVVTATGTKRVSFNQRNSTIGFRRGRRRFSFIGHCVHSTFSFTPSPAKLESGYRAATRLLNLIGRWITEIRRILK